MVKLDWDCLDGGCQAAQTPLGRITAWEDGTLVVPGWENRRYESLHAAKVAAAQHVYDTLLNVNVPELSKHLQELLSIAETMKEDMGAVNWGDIGVVGIEYRLPLTQPQDGPYLVVLIEEASPESKLGYWLDEHLDKDRFPNVFIECEW